jgi:uncharacterized protein YndB with AHSA1/START domain
MNDLGEILNGNTVRFERLLPGPIGRVWDFLTESENLRSWLGETEIELRVGGKIIVRLAADDVMHGTITRCEPPRILAYTWGTGRAGEREEDRSILMFELEEREERVLLVLTHRRLKTETLSEYGAGWDTHLGILMARLNNEEPRKFSVVYREMLPAYEAFCDAKKF